MVLSDVVMPEAKECDGMNVSSSKWLSIIQREYLKSFLPHGGAAIKFAVTPNLQSRQDIQLQLRDMAKDEGLLFAKVDAQFVKMHMMDRVFHKIAKQIDWDDLAYSFLTQLLKENGYQLPEVRADFVLSNIAKLNDREEALLRRDLRSWIEKAIYRHPGMCQEFRLAMVRLCLAQLDDEEANPFLANGIKEWLCGELRYIAALKDALIFQKVARHNARHMLSSLTHWLRILGRPGLVVSLDISRYLVSARPTQSETTFYYTAAAVMDMYEVLRQCIDSMDEMDGCLMVVLAPPEFISDDRRGLNRYEALKLRICEDVRDKYQANPFAPLVRISPDQNANYLEQVELECESIIQPEHAQALVYRRAIEALRAGVPNRDAVQALGCVQPEIEGQFRRMLDKARASGWQGDLTEGILLCGGFGSGKSHVLEHLEQLALQNNFVCSRLVISKETPLYNPVKMYRAAIETMKIPGKRGGTLREIADELNFRNLRYGEFYEWVHGAGQNLDSRLAASLFLYERMVNDRELSHRLVRFWSGDPITNVELKRYVRACSASNPYTFLKISPTDLAIQRCQFVTRLIQVAGYAGWILLIDEAEIIGRYFLKQRAQSYAELARWVVGDLVGHKPGPAAVVALTDDFSTAILEGKGDRKSIPAKLRQSVSETDRALADRVEAGIRLIETSGTSLAGPYARMMEEIQEKIRVIHGAAYGWEPPQLVERDQLSGMRMREYVKGWITKWDLKRLHPDLPVDLEVTPLRPSYREDPEIESSVNPSLASEYEQDLTDHGPLFEESHDQWESPSDSLNIVTAST